MFFAENLKRSVYVASRSVNNDGVSIYAPPVEYRVNCHNVLPTSASASLVTAGTSFFDYQQILADPDYVKDIRPLDKVYVYVTPPDTTDQLARTADYYVKGVTPYPTVTRILLQILTVDETP